MIGLIQRVTEASVTIEDRRTARIESGLLALIGIEKGDGTIAAAALLEKMLTYRIFPDDNDRMNFGLEKTMGALLLVPQFTLVADTRKGLRPGFDRGESPTRAAELFSELVHMARIRYPRIEAGTFGADMQVKLVNNGPVTFWLRSEPDADPVAMAANREVEQ